MSGPYDVIVIGGGVYGACILRDAALRGLSAVLLERGDFGCGTSHNSNKIIHSGIRYLQHLDLPRVLECVQETRNWMRIAPHLVRPLPFVVPSYGWRLRGREVMALGVKIHDLLKRLSGCALPAGGALSRRQVLEWFPMLDPAGLRGGAYWHDAQVLNANRLIDECIQDAVVHGARALRYTRVEALSASAGRITGVVARPTEGGAPVSFDAPVVVNATGPWLNELLPPALQAAHRFDRHYLGMNLVIDQVTDKAGLAMEGPGQGGEAHRRRLYFLTPWKDYSIVGTSHVPWSGSPDRVQYTREAVEDLIRCANSAFPFLRLRPDQVRYVYQGLTPAAGDGEKLTRSRQFSIVDHQRRDNIDGLISVMGVKLTSARFIAERVVNLVERKLGRRVGSCRTGMVPLPGARQGAGGTAVEACAAANHAPAALMTELAAGEVHSLTDLVTCRTELGEFGRLGLDDLEACADAMAALHGWSEDRRQTEYRAARARLRL